MKNIEALIDDDDGSISIGALDDFECVAAAADPHNTVAMLVRRDGETIAVLLKRLDKAISTALDGNTNFDEVNV